MENDKIKSSNFKFSNFILKLFIVFLILLSVCLLDYFHIYSYDKVKDYIDDDINFNMLLDKFIGKKNEEYDENVNGGLIYESPCFSEEVICIKKGVITKIYYDDVYEVTIKCDNGTEIVYSNLQEVYLYIYDKVEEGEVIGKSLEYYEIK